MADNQFTRLQQTFRDTGDNDKLECKNIDSIKFNKLEVLNMKFFFTCCIMLMSIHLLAQDLDCVYLQKYPKRIIFLSKFKLFVTPETYVYVCLKKDSSIVYINTTGKHGKKPLVLRDKYAMKYDNIYLEKAVDFKPLNLTNGKLSGWLGQIENAKISDVEQFIKKYGKDLERENICFQNGYAILCDSTQSTSFPQENKYEGIYHYKNEKIKISKSSGFSCYSFNENQTILNVIITVGSFDHYWEEKYIIIDDVIITEEGWIISPFKLKKADKKTVEKIGKHLSYGYCICENFIRLCKDCTKD